MSDRPEPRTTEKDVTDAVLYALRSGCFFPVPEPKLTASVKQWARWGALRNLHNVIARLEAR